MKLRCGKICRRDHRQQLAQLVIGARWGWAGTVVPVPLARDFRVERVVGQLGLEPELVARIAHENTAIGANQATEAYVKTTRFKPLWTIVGAV
jgi:hypothetical protein